MQDETPAKPITSKPPHRERLLTAMTNAIGDHGYEATTVAQVIAYAGCSRATFYEHFTDKSDCFSAALRDGSIRLSRRFRRATKGADGVQALRPALSDLLNALAESPALGRLVFLAPRAATPTAPNPLLGEFERLTSTNRSRATKPTFDIPPVALLGGITVVISGALAANSSDQLPAFLDDLVAWSETYHVAGSQPPWSTGPQAVLARTPTMDPSLTLPHVPVRPPLLPRGRHSLPETLVARNHHGRILHAVSEATAANGYSATTVVQLASTASITRQGFYDHFSDKEDAALQALRHIHRHSLRGSGAAYFSGDTWPQRIYNAMLYLTTLIADQPAQAGLAILEPYAVGPKAFQALEDTLANYALLLEEGYHQTPTSTSLPRLHSKATIGAIFEVIRHHVAEGQGTQLPRYVPQLTYLAMAPFVGATSASKLVREAIS